MTVTRRRLMWADPYLWTYTGLWVWAPAMLFVLIWTGTQVRLGWRLAVFESLCTWAMLALARWVGARLYNGWIASWAPLTWLERPGLGEGVVLRLPPWSNAAAMGSLALPFGILLGILGNLWGWTQVLPDRWVLFPVVLAVSAWIYGLGSLVLYNRVIVHWFGPFTVQSEPLGGHQALLAHLDARPLFVGISMVSFGWLVTGIVLVWVVAGTLLIVLAHHFPAGWFGFEVECFGAVLGAAIAYLVAIAVGLWYVVGLTLFRWQEHRRGPMPWGHLRDEVTS